MNWRPEFPHVGRVAAAVAVGVVLLMVLSLAIAGVLIGGGSMLFGAGQNCTGGTFTSANGAAAAQPTASAAGRATIPADYLHLYQQAGKKYGVPWVVLAGIGEVETNQGRTSLPGVQSGANAFGAAGPMQIGIGGAAGDTWGGSPVHPASEQVGGVATDGNGDGIASVYEPADAIGGAARYLVAHGVQNNVSGAIFAYNHLTSYVQSVLRWAGVYANGGFSVSGATTGGAVTTAQCLASAAVGGGPGSAQVPNQAVATAITFARSQIGKPYLWGGTGPDAFDCSGLMMMAYRAVGISIPRTSEEQWTWGPKVAPGHEQPGDLVFFAGSDGTATSPGHVAMVIGHGMMLEAYATGFPIRIASYGTPSSPAGDQNPVGFTRPWAHPGVVLTGGGSPQIAGLAGPVSSSPPAAQGMPSPSGGGGGPVTRHTDCVASPHSCGFPDATNTGVPPGTQLTSSGSITVSTDGAVVDAKDVHGTITVEASNVTIKRTRVTSSDHYPIHFVRGKDLTIEDVEVAGSAGCLRAVEPAGDGATMTRMNIHGCEDGIEMYSGDTITDSYIHDLAFTGGSHNDGIQQNGGSNDIVRHNTIFNPHNQTSCVNFTTDFGGISDIMITGNLLNGGNYTVYSRSGGNGDPTGVSITDNHFGRADVFGLLSADGSVTWSGNVSDSMGQTVGQ
jgi:cell wall-associated NlpC family hydrolase